MEQAEHILSILKDLYRISGFRISLHDTLFREVLAYPKEPSPFCRCVQKSKEGYGVCVEMDRRGFALAAKTGEAQIYRCQFGLYEAVSPLYHYGILTGYLMMGQVLGKEEGSRDNALRAALPYADIRSLKNTLDTVPSCTEEEMHAYARIMTVCAEYLTLSGAMKTVGALGKQVEDYLTAHYSERITLEGLAKQFDCSRSTLINAFAATHSVTVFAYLQELRLKHARELLRETALPIGEVARLCGFSDGGYFTKVFRRAVGSNPLAYRNERI